MSTKRTRVKKIRTMPQNDKYSEGFDRIFRGKLLPQIGKQPEVQTVNPKITPSDITCQKS